MDKQGAEIQLPDTLSGMIRLGVKELKWAEDDPHYRVEMHAWHGWKEVDTTQCSVCMAGAIIAHTMGEQWGAETHPEDYGEENSAKLRAVNQARTGWIERALLTMGLDQSKRKDLYQRGVKPDYEDMLPPNIYVENPDRFYAVMETIAADLEAAGA